MNAIGMQAEVLETDGNPLAFGQWLGAPGKTTALIYGHYDVQPADPLELWESPPFEGTVRDGKIFGRGSVDAKAKCSCIWQPSKRICRRADRCRSM